MEKVYHIMLLQYTLMPLCSLFLNSVINVTFSLFRTWRLMLREGSGELESEK